MSRWILEDYRAWINFGDASTIRVSKHEKVNSYVKQILCEHMFWETKLGKCSLLSLIVLVTYFSFLQELGLFKTFL